MWASRWAGPFYWARKVVGVFFLALGLLLIWEMVSMLSAKDYTGKLVFGLGGVALMLLMGGVMCLIAKKGESAFE